MLGYAGGCRSKVSYVCTFDWPWLLSYAVDVLRFVRYLSVTGKCVAWDGVGDTRCRGDNNPARHRVVLYCLIVVVLGFPAVCFVFFCWYSAFVNQPQAEQNDDNGEHTTPDYEYYHPAPVHPAIVIVWHFCNGIPKQCQNFFMSCCEGLSAIVFQQI